MAADFAGLLAKGKAPAMPKLKKLGPTPELAEVEDDEDPMIVRLKPIAQDILDAVRGGDATALAEALMASHGAIGAGPSEAESEIEIELPGAEDEE
jgi:hypothetical protein